MKGDSWQQTTWEDMIIHVSIRRRIITSTERNPLAYTLWDL
jgi:hypothetical protein